MRDQLEQLSREIAQLEKLSSAKSLRGWLTHIHHIEGGNKLLLRITHRFGNDADDIFDLLSKIPKRRKPEGVDTMIKGLASAGTSKEALRSANASSFVLERSIALIEEAGGNVAVSFERAHREALRLEGLRKRTRNNSHVPADLTARRTSSWEI